MNLTHKIIAYINGIRFDPADCIYSSTEGQHATFSLTVPAVPEWAILPERSHCVVFFSDPVSNSWRMLCEGEYVGFSRQRMAVGQRFRSLSFRSTHALFQTTPYASVVGLLSANDNQTPADYLVAYSCGNKYQGNNQNAITPTAKTPATVISGYELAYTSIQAFISATSTPGTPPTATSPGVPGTVFTSFLPAFISAVMQQLPVDAFYCAARRLPDKIFALPDIEIGTVVSTQLWTNLVQQGAFNFIAPNTTLEEIICQLENIAYYHHITVPSPPLYIDPTKPEGFNIPELMIIPQLNSCIPPACNVIFRDQITGMSDARNFLSETTRVICQLSGSAFISGNLPLVFMSNDTERSVNVSQIVANPQNKPPATQPNTPPPNQTNYVANPTTLTIHDFLTLEEYTRGVIPMVINFPFQNLFQRMQQNVGVQPLPLTDSQKNLYRDVLNNYMGHSARHLYDVHRGDNRRATVYCSFLPYIMPGFPCLVEDASGPFWGMVHSVSHSLTPTAQPSTTLEITHVLETYIIDGRVRNAYNPVWLNSAFLPSNIDATYTKILGANAPDAIQAGDLLGSHAAMVPQSIIASVAVDQGTPLNATDQVNLDLLAPFVIPTPHYTASGERSPQVPVVSVADKIRRTADVQLNCLKYQYRAGLTLTQFAKFHGLHGLDQAVDATGGGTNSPNNPDYAFSSTPPPTDLSAKVPGQMNPDELFGTPYFMSFVGKQGINLNGNKYGVYVLQPGSGGSGLVTAFRQQAALTIKAAIDRGLTAG
jgi:hypothetical protein